MSIRNYFENIADAIKTKGGTSTALTPAEMPRAILDLPTGSSTADGVTYDNTTSGLTANNVQDAIDEVVEDISTINSDLSELSDVKYGSWLNATVFGGSQGSNVLTLSKGTYLVIGQAPYTEVEYTVCIKTDDSSQTYIAVQSGSGLLNMSTIFKVTNDSTNVWIANYSSATITYQDIFTGYIKAVRLGD